MEIIGEWATEVSTESGFEYFVEMYDMSPARFMLEYNLHRVSKLQKGKTDFVVLLEYDGTINQMFVFNTPGDRAYVYSDKRLSNFPAFNSEQGAFMDVYTDSGHVRSFFFDNSPYQILEDDAEWHEELVFDEVIEEMIKTAANEGLDISRADISHANTMFVRQL